MLVYTVCSLLTVKCHCGVDHDLVLSVVRCVCKCVCWRVCVRYREVSLAVASVARLQAVLSHKLPIHRNPIFRYELQSVGHHMR